MRVGLGDDGGGLSFQRDFNSSCMELSFVYCVLKIPQILSKKNELKPMSNSTSSHQKIKVISNSKL